jgi:SPP1 family predicted phage head-tail adaptor
MRTVFVDPGALRWEFSLQAPDTARDELGGAVEGWTEVATVFGLLEPVSQITPFGADQPMELHTHRITLRHRPDIGRGMRMSRGGRNFDVVSVSDPDESGRYLVCRVVEQKP